MTFLASLYLDTSKLLLPSSKRARQVDHILSERPLGPIRYTATVSIRLEDTPSALQTESARPLQDGTRDQEAFLLLCGLPGAEGREAREATRPGDGGGRRGRYTRSHGKGPPDSFLRGRGKQGLGVPRACSSV